MQFTDILYSVEDGIARITLNKPEKLNALSWGSWSEIENAIALADSDDGVKVVLITGAGRGFCAGTDLTTGTKESDWPERPLAGRPGMMRSRYLGTAQVYHCRKPTIAAVNGPAFGWGFILSLHCDIRFAARSAMFNATFARIGVPGEKGSAWLLTRAIGPARAMDLLYSARRFDGTEAERLGLVNAVLDDDALMAHVMEYARNIAAYSAPRSLAAMKAQVWTAIDEDYSTAFAAADLEQDKATGTEDFREAFASYREKRLPAFKGR